MRPAGPEHEQRKHLSRSRHILQIRFMAYDGLFVGPGLDDDLSGGVDGGARSKAVRLPAFIAIPSHSEF